MLKLIQPNWNALPNIKAFSTTRAGGKSLPPYHSLNLGDHVGDSPENVAVNRRLLPVPASPCWLQQVHGTDVIAYSQSQQTLVGDGCFTENPNQVCVVMTADCLPLLLTDTTGSFVAALHCGWKGLAGGIVESFLATRSPSLDIIAWLGPAIGPNAFEVGEDVVRAFAPFPQAFRGTVNGKFKADLVAITSAILRAQGVHHIYASKLCTWTSSEQFFSYRRDGVTGRMATCIWVE